jgi:hypothetical protein
MIEAVYTGPSRGSFTTDDGQSRTYDNEIYEIMGGRVKYPTGTVPTDGGPIIEGEVCTLELGEPTKRKMGNYVEFVSPIIRVYAGSFAAVES